MMAMMVVMIKIMVMVMAMMLLLMCVVQPDRGICVPVGLFLSTSSSGVLLLAGIILSQDQPHPLPLFFCSHYHGSQISRWVGCVDGPVQTSLPHSTGPFSSSTSFNSTPLPSLSSSFSLLTTVTVSTLSDTEYGTLWEASKRTDLRNSAFSVD